LDHNLQAPGSAVRPTNAEEDDLMDLLGDAEHFPTAPMANRFQA